MKYLISASFILLLFGGCAAPSTEFEEQAPVVQQSDSPSYTKAASSTVSQPAVPSIRKVQSMEDYLEISPDGAVTKDCSRAYDAAGRSRGEKAQMLDFDTGEWVEAGTVPLDKTWHIESGDCGPLVANGLPGMAVLVNARKESEGLTPQTFKTVVYVFNTDSPNKPAQQIEISEDIGTNLHSASDLVTWGDGFAVTLRTTVGEGWGASAEAFRVTSGEKLWSREGVWFDGVRRAPEHSSSDHLAMYRSDRRYGVLDLETGDSLVEAGNTIYDDDYAEFKFTGAGVVVYRGESHGNSVRIFRNGSRSDVEIPWRDYLDFESISGSENYISLRHNGVNGNSLVVYELSEMKPSYNLTPEKFAGLDVRGHTMIDHYLRIHKTDEVVLLDIQSGKQVAEKEDEYVTSILPNGWGTADVPSEGLRVQQCLVYLKDIKTPISYDFN